MLAKYKLLLKEKGIIEIDLSEFTGQDLLEIASSFGKVVPGARNELIQQLPAREKGTGPIGSFSYTVGYDAFPWHTDTAYWDCPAHYLLLTSDKASSCATLYQRFDVLQRLVPEFDYLMSRAVFLLDVPGKRHYLSPCIKKGNYLVGYRLDFHVFKPINEEAKTLMENVGQVLADNYERQFWTGTNAIILDNRRFIHSRECVKDDRKRILKRVYIDELD